MILLICNVSYAQNIPTGGLPPQATPVTTPGQYVNPVTNYIRTREPAIPVGDAATVTNTADVRSVRQSTEYFDAFGSLQQKVVKGFSPQGNDLVTPYIYDAFRREQYNYLPYAAPTGDGKLKLNPFQDQAQFIKSLYPLEKIYYKETQFEPTPLNRITKSMSAGNSWAGSARGVSQRFLSNTAADDVRAWDISAANLPVSTKGYEVGQLYKTVTTDENGFRKIEFTDKEERKILTKEETVVGTADGNTNWLCTYYVYDNIGNLRFIIPPKAVKLSAGSWSPPQDMVNELCFYYAYDTRNRMVEKKFPSAAIQEQVFDLRDRLVFSRDGKQKADGQWLAYFYDELNRPILTAIYKSGSDRTVLQNQVNSINNGNGTITSTFPGIADLEVAVHDGRSKYQATNSISFNIGFESGDNAVFETELGPTAGQSQQTITVSNAVAIPASDLTPLIYTFYDNYGYADAHTFIPGDFAKLKAGNNIGAEFVSAASNRTKGLITGKKVRILGTDQWLTTSYFYGDKQRIIQTISDNATGGKNVLSKGYDFRENVLSSYLKHTNPRSALTPQTTVMTMFAYDNADRVTAISKQLNDDGVNKVIVQRKYDELGRLDVKTLGNNIESLDYDYNIQGWLSDINKQYAQNGGQNYFGTSLYYDYGYTTRQYNGNIAGMTWRSKNDNEYRSFGFSYDGANRLLKADFTQNNGQWNNSAGVNFSMMLGDGATPDLAYDANGNILSLTRNGLKGTSSPVIDQLKYTYVSGNSGNRLQGVIDVANDPSSVLGDFKEVNGTGDNDYSYDANGNITRDNNRNIPEGGISYNYLNLPEKVTVTNKGTVQYLYDATGTKLRKIVTDKTVTPARTIIADYIGDFLYEQDTLRFFQHDEGRIRLVYKSGQPPAYTYDYFLKDHQNNTRVVLTEQSDLSVYTATMEQNVAARETALFSNVDKTRSPAPVGYPGAQGISGNQFVAKLSARQEGNKIGPSLVLRVLTGDTIQVGAQAFYKSQQPDKSDRNAIPAEMLTSLAQTFTNPVRTGADHGALSGPGTNGPFASNFTSADYQRLKEKDPDQNYIDKPKAFLNFVLFDEQFKLVDGNSGVKQVKGEPDQLQMLGTDKMVMKKSGFLYVYTSNESQQDVFFDNVTVTQATGPILETTHYYPFGLPMAGISSNALKGTSYPENRRKYNGNELQTKEFSDGTGLDWYDFNARSYDAQTSRFMQVDPMIDEDQEHLTPYHFAYNNPVRFADPDGKLAFLIPVAIALVEAGEAAYTGYRIYQTAHTAVTILSMLQAEHVAVRTARELSTPASDNTRVNRNAPPPSGAVRLVNKKKGGGIQELLDGIAADKAKQEAKEKKDAHQQAEKNRAQGRTGNSNQNVRGEHNSGGKSKSKRNNHEDANARRAREQAAADAKNNKNGGNNNNNNNNNGGNGSNNGKKPSGSGSAPSKPDQPKPSGAGGLPNITNG
ncbi:MAG TPA: DUF6443 domain-containing protein [Chitinophaga sp.]|uniref:DUF6443 domain-containing protein n=1 Tax=Chitinophaga sp. TaxID=1869181 RepID=UPI002BC47C86|nr:DUF6443 domain-containing protein [Chitinophaga sp.]HVI44391.1 DUF6443 domain-containing protein [Chitinophaga sp.]